MAPGNGPDIADALEPGWLKRQLEKNHEEIRHWPMWMRRGLQGYQPDADQSKSEVELELEQRIKELEGELANANLIAEGLKDYEVVKCGCRYNKQWAGTRWEHWLVRCEEHRHQAAIMRAFAHLLKE